MTPPEGIGQDALVDGGRHQTQRGHGQTRSGGARHRRTAANTKPTAPTARRTAAHPKPERPAPNARRAAKRRARHASTTAGLAAAGAQPTARRAEVDPEPEQPASSAMPSHGLPRDLQDALGGRSQPTSSTATSGAARARALAPHGLPRDLRNALSGRIQSDRPAESEDAAEREDGAGSGAGGGYREQLEAAKERVKQQAKEHAKRVAKQVAKQGARVGAQLAAQGAMQAGHGVVQCFVPGFLFCALPILIVVLVVVLIILGIMLLSGMSAPGVSFDGVPEGEGWGDKSGLVYAWDRSGDWTEPEDWVSSSWGIVESVGLPVMPGVSAGNPTHAIKAWMGSDGAQLRVPVAAPCTLLQDGYGTLETEAPLVPNGWALTAADASLEAANALKYLHATAQHTLDEGDVDGSGGMIEEALDFGLLDRVALPSPPAPPSAGSSKRLLDFPYKDAIESTILLDFAKTPSDVTDEQQRAWAQDERPDVTLVDLSGRGSKREWDHGGDAIRYRSHFETICAKWHQDCANGSCTTVCDWRWEATTRELSKVVLPTVGRTWADIYIDDGVGQLLGRARKAADNAQAAANAAAHAAQEAAVKANDGDIDALAAQAVEASKKALEVYQHAEAASIRASGVLELLDPTVEAAAYAATLAEHAAVLNADNDGTNHPPKDIRHSHPHTAPTSGGSQASSAGTPPPVDSAENTLKGRYTFYNGKSVNKNDSELDATYAGIGIDEWYNGVQYRANVRSIRTAAEQAAEKAFIAARNAEQALDAAAEAAGYDDDTKKDGWLSFLQNIVGQLADFFEKIIPASMLEWLNDMGDRLLDFLDLVQSEIQGAINSIKGALLPFSVDLHDHPNFVSFQESMKRVETDYAYSYAEELYARSVAAKDGKALDGNGFVSGGSGVSDDDAVTTAKSAVSRYTGVRAQWAETAVRAGEDALSAAEDANEAAVMSARAAFVAAAVGAWRVAEAALHATEAAANLLDQLGEAAKNEILPENHKYRSKILDNDDVEIVKTLQTYRTKSLINMYVADEVLGIAANGTSANGRRDHKYIEDNARGGGKEYLKKDPPGIETKINGDVVVKKHDISDKTADGVGDKLEYLVDERSGGFLGIGREERLAIGHDLYRAVRAMVFADNAVVRSLGRGSRADIKNEVVPEAEDIAGKVDVIIEGVTYQDTPLDQAQYQAAQCHEAVAVIWLWSGALSILEGWHPLCAGRPYRMKAKNAAGAIEDAFYDGDGGNRTVVGPGANAIDAHIDSVLAGIVSAGGSSVDYHQAELCLDPYRVDDPHGMPDDPDSYTDASNRTHPVYLYAYDMCLPVRPRPVPGACETFLVRTDTNGDGSLSYNPLAFWADHDQLYVKKMLGQKVHPGRGVVEDRPGGGSSGYGGVGFGCGWEASPRW